MPLSASTASPESSATAGWPVAAATARALSSAFSWKLRPVSATSGTSGNSSTPTRSTASPASARIRLSSTTLCALRVARTTVGRDATARSAREGRALERGQVGAAAGGEVEQRVEHLAVKRLGLGGALDLDEAAVAGHDDVHVGVGAHVLLVVQVEARLTVDDADRDRGNGAGQGLGGRLDPALLLGERHGVGQRDVG